MLRMIRVEYSGAKYRVMDRKNRREDMVLQTSRGDATQLSIHWRLLDSVEERTISGTRLSPPSPAL
jgi:hypothetical protein